MQSETQAEARATPTGGAPASPSSPPPRGLDRPSDAPGPDGAPSRPRTPLGEACALALTCALVGSIPAALRAARAGGPFLGGWLASAAIVLPLLATFIWLSRAAGRGFRMLTGNRVGRSTAAGLALWIGLSMPALVVLGSVLKATTHHRGLGGATFGVVALGVVVGASLVARRLVGTARSLAERGRNPRLIAAAFAVITIAPLLAVAFPLVRGTEDSDASRGVVAALVDGAIFVVASALAANVELGEEWRARAKTWGLGAAAAAFAVGFGWVLTSQSLGVSLRNGGGLAAALMGGLERWTDRDHDGAGSSFGGGDCDEGDPRRHPGAFDVPGDGIDQDCDGHDAPAVVASDVEPSPRSTGSARAVAASAASSGARPSVVLVTLDTVRADHTSAYGYEKKTTPALDGLAASSALFLHAYATGSDTTRALAPLVSGRVLTETTRDRREWPSIPASIDTIAERMKRAGYLTGAVTSFTWLSREHGFDQGFDSFDAAYKEDHPERGITGPHAVRAARAFLAKNAADPRPLFLWVHLFDAHESYLPHTGIDFGHDKRGLYDGEIAYVDVQLSELLDAVRSSPRGASTAIIVHGSNGEAFGEHATNGHGKELYEPQLRVPLVVSIPGAQPLRYGAGAVSTLDIAPTILELGGAPMDDVAGSSLLPLATGERAARREVVFAASARKSVVIDWPLKLLVGGEKKGRSRALFDLSADPNEADDVAGARAADVERLEKLLVAPPADGRESSG